MKVFISKKLSFVLLFCACSAACGVTFLSNYLLTGPKLSPIYDLLLGFRSSTPVSREILIIDTDEVIEPGDLFPVLMTLSEMGASNLLVEVPVLGSGSGRLENGQELSYRIYDEFTLLERNIKNLFEAIRMGLISPSESPGYVENLVDLAIRGRDRLNSAIIQQEEAGSILAEQATAVFGKALSAEDLRVQSWAMPEHHWYSQPRYDSDRIFRRIAPTLNDVDHIVYYALKPRWIKSEIELTETGLVMVNRFERQGEDMEYRFPLDRNGNIIIEKPGKNTGFRHLGLKQFHTYDQIDRAMARLLKESEPLGVYAETIPERMPNILFEYVESLKEELLKAPSTENHSAWLYVRMEYITCLDEFLYSPSEMILVNSYEERIAAENDEKNIVQLLNQRDELIRAFVAMREQHREFSELRSSLEGAIASSFCIMGPATMPEDPSVNIPESSALFANSLLTGACITPGQSRHIIVLSIAGALIVLVCIHALGPAMLLLTGFAASLFCGAAFGISFIFSGYWIDPLVPMTACLTGTLFLTISRFCIGYGRMSRFRLAYLGSVNKAMLKQLVKAGRPLPSEIVCAKAVIVAVKNSGMTGKEDQGLALESAKAVMDFRWDITSVFKRRGGLILGYENDLVLACFGSPPQRICGESNENPVTKVISCIRDILENAKSTEWHFGIESGECSFYWSDKTGYTANGHAVVRARMFASLAVRHNVRAIIGNSASKGSRLQGIKLSSLAGEYYYKLPF
jgi:hypothetical protein